MKSVDDIELTRDSELYGILTVHYKKNNHFEVSIRLLAGFFIATVVRNEEVP